MTPIFPLFVTRQASLAVGSIIGIRNGFSGIDEVWTKPVNGKLETSIFGVGVLDLDKAAAKTMRHIAGDTEDEEDKKKKKKA